jgi:hypothetical protein
MEKRESDSPAQMGRPPSNLEKRQAQYGGLHPRSRRARINVDARKSISQSRENESKGKMTDLLQTDNRLRAILSSLYRSPRYRSEAVTRHWNHPVPSSSQTELNRELKEVSRPWQLFFAPLLILTIIDYFYLQHWG